MKAVVLIVSFGQNRSVWEATGYSVTPVKLFCCPRIYMGRDFLCSFKISWNTEYHSFAVHLHPFGVFCIFSLKWSFHLQFHLFSSSSSVAFTWNAHLFVLPKTSLLLHLIFTLTHLARPFLPSPILNSVALSHINNKFLFFMFKVSS